MGTESITERRNSENSSVFPAKNGLGMIITNPQERTRFLRFAMVGLIGAVVDFGIANLLTTVLHLMDFVPASIISFTAAVISNFMWNRFWTYPDSRSKAISKQVVQFVIISVIGLLIRTPIIQMLESPTISLYSRIVPVNFFLSPRFLGHNTILAIAVLIVMMWNFFANRFWTYNDVS